MKKTHGERHPITKEYQAWGHMKRRCYNENTPQFCDYGGRGIVVCDAWLNSYETFLKDMGRAPSPKHTLDRIDNDGNYEPSNCRWATRFEQNVNRRNNVLITLNGEVKTLQEWCNIHQIDRNTVKFRLKKGWPKELAFSITPDNSNRISQ